MGVSAHVRRRYVGTVSNIIRNAPEREERPTRKMRPEDLLGLVKTSGEKPVDLTPEIEVVDPSAPRPEPAPAPVLDADDDLAIPIEHATGSGAMTPVEGPYVIASPREAPASRVGTWIAVLAVIVACAIAASDLVAHRAGSLPVAASSR